MMAAEATVAILALMLTYHALAGAAAQHTCAYSLDYTLANCSRKHLQMVPWGLHANIHILDLSNNRLSTIQAFAFQKYSQLQVLTLHNNSITILNNPPFLQLSLLHSLDLSFNQLHTVPSSALSPLVSLFVLSLAGNNLIFIDDNAFLSLSQLKYLDLSGNRISIMTPRSLDGLTKLEELRLERNALPTIHQSMFLALPRLQQVYLYRNPWFCDCKLRWLRQWMENSTHTVWRHPREAVQCDGPTITHSKDILSLPLSELACNVEMRTSGSTKIVDMGTDVVMECVYFSIPTIQPIWQRNHVPMDIAGNGEKFEMTVEGAPVITTRLTVKDFQHDDITEYECLARNVRGSDSTVFRVTLQGVPFHSVIPASGEASMTMINESRNIVIIVGILCGVVLITALSVSAFCCTHHVRQLKQEKRQAAVENVKRHFLSNGEITDAFTNAEESLEERSTNCVSGARTRSTIQHHEMLRQCPDDDNNLQSDTYHHRHLPSTYHDGNTYISFGSDADPDQLHIYPCCTGVGYYNGSRTESTTPLLDQGHTLSVFDEPTADRLHRQYPMYEYFSLHYPRQIYFPSTMSPSPAALPTPSSVRSCTRSTNYMSTNYTSTNSLLLHEDYQVDSESRRREMTPLQQALLAKKRSMSVGNVGCTLPPPQKPPRLHQPSQPDSPDDYLLDSSRHTRNGMPFTMSLARINVTNEQHKIQIASQPGTPV